MTPGVGEQDLATESWAFALQLYARPNVAAACLTLQDEAGVDVMLLLVVTFAALKCRMALGTVDIAEMDAACRPWREQVVHPLRALRIALKSGPQPAPVADTEKLRLQIKASELVAERLQNDLLAKWLQSKSRQPAALLARDQSRDMVRCVVMLALQKRKETQNESLWFAVDAIRAAAESIA